MRTEFTARTVIFCLGVALLAAFSYAVVGHLWVLAAHRNTGPLLFSAPSFTVLKVAAIFTLAVSAAVTARRAGTHWALAATGTGLLGMLAGLGFYWLGERVFWPELWLGCQTFPIADVGYHAECLSSFFPLYHFDAVERYILYAIVLATVAGLAVASGSVARRLRGAEDHGSA